MNKSWYPPPSRPRPVEGGLKARSTRGAIARTWWSERFIAVLEDIGLGNRLQRGRTYARKGQVISLEVDPGSVTAEVQGSGPGRTGSGSGSPRSAESRIGPGRAGAWLKMPGTPPNCCPARCPTTSRTSSPGSGYRCSPPPPGSCRWTAPARSRRPLQAPCRHLYLLADSSTTTRRHPGVARPRARGSAGRPGRRPHRRTAGRRPRRTSSPTARGLP